MNKIFIYFFLHFAISAWPFLNFYASEINHKLVSVLSFSLLFLIFWGVALLSFELLKKIFRVSRERILVAYTFFILLFFSFQYYRNFVVENQIPKSTYLFVLILLLTIFAAYKFSKFTVFQKAIQLFIFIIFSFSLLENSFIYFKKERNSTHLDQNNRPSYVFNKKPNIYFLVLDTYPGFNILQSKTQYDNTEFIDFLKNKGFIVAENAHSNYSSTSPSVSATLQMNYLAKENNDEDDIFSPDKAVLNILKQNNYKFVSIPGHCDFLVPKTGADLIISPNSLLFSLSNLNFLQTTFLYVFTGWVNQLFYFGDKEIMKIFEFKEEGSKFVYIHYLHLHDFIYKKNCTVSLSLMPSQPTFEDFNSNLLCLNAFVITTINEIIKHDPEAIIIAQGDHGPPFWRNQEEVNTLDDFNRIFSIFSGVYIPDLDKHGPMAQYLAKSPSSVNNFRIIFSYLSGEPVELLPDKYYLTPHLDVTDKVHSLQNRN